MKKISSLCLLIVAFCFTFTACQKEKVSPAGDDKKVSSRQPEMMLLDDKQSMQVNSLLFESNKKRLEKSKLRISQKACMTSIHVPKDYATIQAAVDAACPNADILVSEGTYTELVVIATPGLHVKAIGSVSVNGGFVLSPDADNVKIQQFTILPQGDYYAIDGTEVSGVQIIQNIVPNNIEMWYRGIVLRNASDCTIKDNHIDGARWGIAVTSVGETGLSTNNRILNNSVLNITFASAIHLQGNVDNNVVSGNTIRDKTGGANGGITLATMYDFFTDPPVQFTPDGNTVRDNISSNGASMGLWVIAGGSQNTIGPNNQFNNNEFSGIVFGFSFNSYVFGMGSGNNIFNNEALGNVICDILDQNLTTYNTYKNNEYTCFSDTF